MAAFTKAIRTYYPNEKFDFVLSFKKGKDYTKILKYIIPLAKKIYISNFIINTQGFKIESENELILAKIINSLEFFNIEIINPIKICSLIRSKKSNFIITGSLYFIADQVNNHKLIDNK
jgi:folylpolyglutamate synthase/dihydropteroate synthase